MRTFDVLSKEEEIPKKLILEASAGTGKTFAIEHLVARLLLEEKSIAIDEILVITFTRAVAKELKNRIRNTLQKISDALEQRDPLYPYLIPFLDNLNASSRVRRALRYFDEAQVFTIHSFCARQLSEQTLKGELKGLKLDREELSSLKKYEILQDLFLLHLEKASLTQEALRILLNHYQNDLQKLLRAVLPLVEQNVCYHSEGPLERKRKWESGLKSALEWDQQQIYQDLQDLLKFYKGVSSRSGELKEEVLNTIEIFCRALFDTNAWEDLLACGAKLSLWLEPKQAKKGFELATWEGKTQAFWYWFEREGGEYLKRTMDPQVLFLELVDALRMPFQEKVLKEDSWTPNELLKSMLAELENPAFCDAVRKKYRACIVDEFQDTDHTQWSILSKLFVYESAHLPHMILVGDPKQSIYSFRHSDLKIYVKAKASLGEGALRCLATNYRSHQGVVDAMNALFTPEKLFKVDEEEFITCPEVLAARPRRVFKDGRGALCITRYQDLASRSKSLPSREAEESLLIPYLEQEIRKLCSIENAEFSDIALLVRDRFQAERIRNALEERGIPAVTRRKRGFSTEKALKAMQQLAAFLYAPHSVNNFKIFFGGPLLQAKAEDLQEESEAWQQAYSQLFHMSELSKSKGFMWFCREVLHRFHNAQGLSVAEYLLSQHSGEDLLQQWLQLAEVASPIMDAYQDPLRLQSFLDRLPDYAWGDDERALVRQAHDSKSCQILTLHVSKGLEFPYVFALGACSRSTVEPSFVIHFDPKETRISLWDPESPESLLQEKEREYEKIRELYVALTRASERVYLPVPVPCGKRLKPPRGNASLWELYLAWRKYPGVDSSALYAEMESGTHMQASFKSEEISIEDFKEEFTTVLKDLSKKKTLILPSMPEISKTQEEWTSFSRMLQKQRVAPSEEVIPRDWDNEVKSVYTLPVGVETGTLLHELIERFPFRKLRDKEDLEEWKMLISPFLRGDYSAWLGVFAEIVRNAFSIPLLSDKRPLLALSENQLYREVDFLFGDFSDKKRYTKGVIDLLFLDQGKVYYIDWKSHFLGDSASSYTEESIWNCFKDDGYQLQADIYENAVRRYLTSIGSPWEFGGGFFVFLRALEKSSSSGIIKLTCQEKICIL